jgi:hypothetical protein
VNNPNEWLQFLNPAISTGLLAAVAKLAQLITRLTFEAGKLTQRLENLEKQNEIIMKKIGLGVFLFILLTVNNVSAGTFTFYCTIPQLNFVGDCADSSDSSKYYYASRPVDMEISYSGPERGTITRVGIIRGVRQPYRVTARAGTYIVRVRLKNAAGYSCIAGPIVCVSFGF